MVSYSGWLKHCSRLRQLEKRFTFLGISLQDTQIVTELGAENSTRSLTG
jgi:hypothetical protein